jgi:hypothetical protein
VRTKSAKDTTVTLQWDAMGVHYPGTGDSDAVHVFSAHLYYLLYVTDTTTLASASDDDRADTELSLKDTYITSTSCGLNHMAESPAASQHVKIIRVLAPPQGKSNQVEHTLEELTAGHRYHIVVTAHCDAHCLEQVGKTVASTSRNGNDNPTVCASADLPCQPQVALYPEVVVDTKTSWNWGSSSGGAWGWPPSTGVLITVTVVVIVIAVVLLLALGYYRNKLWMSRNRGFEALDTIDRRHQPNAGARGAGNRGSSSIGNAIRSTASSVQSAVGKLNPMKGQYTPPTLSSASTYSPLNSAQQEDDDDDIVETQL